MQSTRNETARNAWIKLGMGIVFTGIGALVVYLAIQMVGAFGEGMGVDAASKEIYARAHKVIHIFGTASAVAVGLFLMGRNKVLATLALLAIFGCGGYGIVNMIGFTTTNRLSVAESKDAANSADWKQYEARRAAIQGDIDWARKTVLEEESPREKRRILTRIDAKLKELEAVQPPRPSALTVLADPQATWFARLTNSDTGKWQLALPIPVAILMFVAEVLSFVFAVHLIAQAVETLLGTSFLRKDGGGDSGSGKVKEPEKTTGNITSFPPKPAALKVADNDLLPGLPAKVSKAYTVSADAVDELLQQIIARGHKAFAQNQVARFCGKSEGQVSKILAEAEKQGKVTRSRHGNRKSVRIRVGDGGGRQAIAAG